jgi:hypothetical protein
MEKEYKKFTADQFNALIDTLPEIRKEGNDFRSVIASVPATRLDELMEGSYNWAFAYELTFHEHAALWAAAGFEDTLLRWNPKLEVGYGSETAVQPGVQA